MVDVNEKIEASPRFHFGRNGHKGGLLDDHEDLGRMVSIIEKKKKKLKRIKNIMVMKRWKQVQDFILVETVIKEVY